jgi:polysaccharide biosynthesis/export protein
MSSYQTVCLILLNIHPVICQQVTHAAVANDSPNLPFQQIGADDLIGLYVYDSPELTRTVRVGADGAIHLPLLKIPIKASGLFPFQLECSIVEALRAQNLFVDPVVTVAVVEYRSRPIKVVGAVKTPATFQASGTTTLLDALSFAGGLSEFAGPDIVVSGSHFNSAATSTALSQRIRVKDLISGSDPALNLRLFGGEEIRVPDAGKIYVVGNIKKPGVFPIRDDSESSVLRILALTEGLVPFATKTAYIYRQEGGTKGGTEIPVDLNKIMERKAPDIPLLANDILYIPDNKGRRGMTTAVEKVLLLGGGLGAAAIYAVR